MSTAAIPAVSAAVPPPSEPGSQRLMSLDALRGFDMFWILGGDFVVTTAGKMSGGGEQAWTLFGWLASQFRHKDWDGFAFYDLIFPLFVFISGVSVVFSLTKETQLHGRAGALQRVVRRAALLFVLGIFYSGGVSKEWPDIRLLGVLQRIALAYLGAGLVFCLVGARMKALAGIVAGILIGYWALLNFVPIRDIALDKAKLAELAEAKGDTRGAIALKSETNPSATRGSRAWAKAEELFRQTKERTTGQFGPGHNLANHLDFKFLPGRKYDLFYDPEGILSTLPAVATCLLGVLAGVWLRREDFCDQWKVIYLLSAGAGALIVGFAWGISFPVVKKIWTSSFVLVAGGYSALLLAVFYQIVDVWKRRDWCQPFVWIGMNSITIYVANNLLQFRAVATRLVGGDVKKALDANVADGAGNLLIALVGFTLIFAFVRFLHQRKIFLRL
jgi:predicted acyltransferase